MMIVKNVPSLLRYFVLVYLQKIQQKQYTLCLVILSYDYLQNGSKNTIKQFISFLILILDEAFIEDSLLVKCRKGR
jgi:hypothetical protein